MLKCSFFNFGHLFKYQVPVLTFPCSYPLFLVIFTILFHMIWWRTELATILLLNPTYHVMENSLPSISHSIKMPAHHFLNFFLTYHHHKCTYSLGSFCSGLWPLSTLIWDYQIAFFITGDTTNPQILQFPWQHCHIITVSLFFHSYYIIPVRFWSDFGYFSIDDLNLASFEGFPLAQGMF